MTTAQSRTYGYPIGLAGLCGVVIGPFLPWVTSGRTTRNVYQLAGLVEQLDLAGAGPALPVVVSVAGPLCLLPVILVALRAVRTAAIGALILGVASLGASVAMAIAESRVRIPGIVPSPIGPVVTAVGGIIVMVAAAGILARRKDEP